VKGKKGVMYCINVCSYTVIVVCGRFRLGRTLELRIKVWFDHLSNPRSGVYL
jgi:hypothetical protein